MCGIAGIVAAENNSPPVALEEVRAMCSAMTHRGPDEDGYFVTPLVGLGMRRLSIIDLHGGRQPIANEDGTVIAVFNGEIYNHHALRRELKGRGHLFRTATDTEVLVHLYEEKGAACVDDLRGMFVFAIWDTRRRRLLVARDRLGIKPLYYTWAGGRLAFASELKGLLQLPAIERRVDADALGHLLTTLYTPATESILTGVHKLEPGHLFTVGPDQPLQVSRYWQVEFAPVSGRPVAALEEELLALLDESVGLHMISDVPVGAFLSGGVDSSSVVSAMVPRSARPVKTFSIGFPEKEFSELEAAREVAAVLGTEHRELVVEPSSLAELEEIAWHLDEPFGDSSAIPTWFVSKLAAQEVKVVLSGDGGDELFGGYDRYQVEGRERTRYRPGWLRLLLGAASAGLPQGAYGKRWLHHNSLPPAERYLDAGALFTPEARRGLLSTEFARTGRGAAALGPKAAAAPEVLHWLSALQRRDLQSYLPLDILTKVDRMSMAHSIEARVPLLDHKLVEFAATLPPDLLIQGGTGKYLFKRALRGRLPKTVLERPKRGFAIPLGRWFRGRLGDFARDLLLSTTSRQRGFFDPAAVERLLAQPDQRDDLGLQLWTLLSFELWCRAFLDTAPSAARMQPQKAREERRPWPAIAG